MARNQEKAQAMLNRLITAKKDATLGVKQKRPFLATEVESLPEAERWRAQIIKEITRSVSSIQNGTCVWNKREFVCTKRGCPAFLV